MNHLALERVPSRDLLRDTLRNQAPNVELVLLAPRLRADLPYQ